jgi:DNA-directed RNA polymerase specialized sigma24 family protein
MPDLPVRDAGLDAVPTRVVFAQALGRLTPKQRAVLVLRFFEDQTEASTAEVLGVSVGTVKSQTAVAIGRLRALAPELAALVEPDNTASASRTTGEISREERR